MEKQRLPDKHAESLEPELHTIRETDGTEEHDTISSTMFVQADKEMFVQVGRCTACRFDTCLLESESALDEYLENDASDFTGGHVSDSDKIKGAVEPAGHFFLLDPSFGWGRLQITQCAMSKIKRHYQMFSQFSKYLRVFGEKTFARDEGFGGYNAITLCDAENKATCFESCFLWKYVEPGGSDGRYPYSIRQTLIYQKFETKTKQSTNVIIRIPYKLAARMKSALTSSDGNKHHLLDRWTGLQMMCAASGVDEWRDFINYLDHEVSKLFDDLILSGVNATTHGKADELQYRLSSMKRLQFFLDQILRAGHMLDVNATTLSTMLHAFRRRKDHIPDLPSLQERLEDIQQEYGFLQKMSKSVLDRAVMLSHELRDTIALRNHDINKQANDAATQGTHAIVELSRKSAYEARVVKLLSVVAVVFLPASFAADFLQMGYVFVTEEKRFKIHATADLWLYAIFAVPLFIVTMSIYVVFELLSRRRAKKKAYLVQEMKREGV